MGEDRTGSPSMLARAEEIQREIQQLSGRDLQLWSIGILIILILTGGLLALLVPNLMWAQRVVMVQHSYLPQLFFGLISLVVLFNIYVMGQKLTLNATRRALIRELVLNERLESLSLIDPLSQLLNRRAMNELIPTEIARVNRLGGNLSFMPIEVNGLNDITAKFGTLEGDLLIVEFAKMLKLIFRGGDVVFRQGKEQFMILLPDTNEQQADAPVQRLARMVEQWNLNNNKGYELSFSCAVASYVTGTDYEDILRTTDRKMFQKKNSMVPIF
jgi:diguanylate cyclase (GGDEF)-like protein